MAARTWRPAVPGRTTTSLMNESPYGVGVPPAVAASRRSVHGVVVSLAWRWYRPWLVAAYTEPSSENASRAITVVSSSAPPTWLHDVPSQRHTPRPLYASK